MSIYPINNAPITGRLIVAGLVTAVFCIGWLLGHSQTGEKPASTTFADSQITRLQQENLRLADEVKLLSGHRFTHEQAIDELQASLTEMRLKRSREREELVMFRNLAQGKARTGGIFIEPIKIEAQGDSQFKIKVSMTQPRGRKRVNGTVAMIIEGLNADGQSVEFDLSDLASDTPIPRQAQHSEAKSAKKYPAFDFRYFADFAFDIQLPRGFMPEALTVAAKPENPYSPTIKSVRRIFPWYAGDSSSDADFTE